MLEERKVDRRLRDHPWIAALFAALASLFIYTIWFVPHDGHRDAPAAQSSAPPASKR